MKRLMLLGLKRLRNALLHLVLKKLLSEIMQTILVCQEAISFLKMDTLIEPLFFLPFCQKIWFQLDWPCDKKDEIIYCLADC